MIIVGETMHVIGRVHGRNVAFREVLFVCPFCGNEDSIYIDHDDSSVRFCMTWGCDALLKVVYHGQKQHRNSEGETL